MLPASAARQEVNHAATTGGKVENDSARSANGEEKHSVTSVNLQGMHEGAVSW